MKKILICLLILGILVTVAVIGITHINKFRSPEINYGNLPIIRITTENGKFPKDKEIYLNCSFEITNCENSDHNFKVEMKNSYDSKEGDGGVGVRLRGNTTMAYEKKPYRI